MYLCSNKRRRWGREKSRTIRAQKLKEKNEIQPKRDLEVQEEKGEDGMCSGGDYKMKENKKGTVMPKHTQKHCRA